MAALLAYWQPLALVLLAGLVATHRGRRLLRWLIVALLWRLPRYAIRRALWHEAPCDHGRRHERLFSHAQAEVIRTRAGGQCERHDPATGHRCLAFASAPGVLMHSDHVVAHAHGGPTVVDNGQLLCAPCNLAKSGRLVTRHELDLLAGYRRSYMRPVPRPERYLP